MRIDVVSLFPDFVRQCAAVGVVGRAQQRELLQVETWNPRDYATDRHRTVDASSYGGGPGMVMMIEPLRTTLAAMREAVPEPVHLIYLSPQGARLTQGRVEALAKRPRIALLRERFMPRDRAGASRARRDASTPAPRSSRAPRRSGTGSGRSCCSSACARTRSCACCPRSRRR